MFSKDQRTPPLQLQLNYSPSFEWIDQENEVVTFCDGTLGVSEVHT